MAGGAGLELLTPSVPLAGVQLCQGPVHLGHGQAQAFPPGPEALLQQWAGDWHLPQQTHQGHLQTLAEEAVPEEHGP